MTRNTTTKMIRSRKRYKIDKAKLYGAIWDKGYQNIYDFSVDAGFGSSSISTAASTGFMTNSMVAVIESMGIPKDLYVVGELTTWQEGKPAEKEKVPAQKEKHGGGRRTNHTNRRCHVHGNIYGDHEHMVIHP